MNPFLIPRLNKYVNDFSHILSSEQIEGLSKLFLDHEKTTTEQVVTLLIPHREWNELLDIGLKVFNENGIGQKNLNNGLLLIVSTEEKKLRIITGKGLELKYTEMVCRDIVENHLRPLLEAGKYEEMIQKWSEVIKNSSLEYSAIPSPALDKNTRENIKSISIFGGFSMMFGIFFINAYISGAIGLGVAMILWIFIYQIRGLIGKKVFSFLMIFPIVLSLLSFLAFLTPASCTLIATSFDGRKDYQCERSVLGYKRVYSFSTGGKSSSSSSSHNSSSSSFGWGGWSSNGWGYWD